MVKKDEFYIEDYTIQDKKKEKESLAKKKIRDALRANIQQSMTYAKHKEPEQKISRLKRIFSLNGEDETIITLRYGSIVFYHGISHEQRVFKGKDEDYDAKIGLLERLTKMVDDNKWFNEQYQNYLKTKEAADKKSAATKKKNKNNVVKATATKAFSKKSTTQKSSAKKVTAKASAKKSTSKTKSKKK
jgi:hypothetical protein